jgi:hypothetical protein
MLKPSKSPPLEITSDIIEGTIPERAHSAFIS